MNYGLALVAKILETQNVNEAIKAGAKSPGLLDSEAKMYFDIIMDHHAQYHQVPSLELFREKVPSYSHVPVTDNVEALVDQLKTIRLANEMEDILSKVARIGAGDPWEGKAQLLQLVEGLSARHSKGNHYYILGEDVEETMATLERLKKKLGLEGYPWPWEYFNQESKGVCDGETYYIYGRQKSRKTFLILFMALYYWALGLKVLVFTREMSFTDLKYRMIALNGNYDFKATIKSQLPEGSEKRIEQFLRNAWESEKFVITDVQDGINGFQATIEDIKPDIVFHDYFKAIADDAMGGKVHQENKYVARTIDQIVDYNSGKAKIPIFLCGHANREGARSRGRSSTEHAWSDQITRRIHAAFRVITHAGTNRMALFVNEGRSIQKGIGVTLNAKLCDGFGEMISTDYSWATAVQEGDEDQPPAPTPSSSTQRRPSAPQGPPQPLPDDVIDLTSFK